MVNSGPARIIVFTGGAELQGPVIDFIGRLESDDSLDLVAVLCQTDATGIRGVLMDLWRRRGLMAIPLSIQRLLRALARRLFRPRAASVRRRTLETVAPRVRYEPDIHSDRIIQRVREMQPDIGLAYGGPILRPMLFELPRLGTLGIHHGLTPDYRGKKTTFWAMYNGEPLVGVTIQRICAGLDRGDIILEAKLPVGKSPLPIVVQRLERMGLDLYLKAIHQVLDGTASGRPQTAGNRPLYRDPSATDVLQFWLRYLARVFNGTPRN